MRPDVAAVYCSPKAPLTGASASGRLRLAMQAGPLSFMPRILDPAITDAIDAIDPATLPSLDVSGSVDRTRKEVETVFAIRDAEAVSALAWLRQDVLDLTALFAAAAGVGRLRVRLQVIDDDMCRRLHVDNVSFRLVTTYRGPGTEFVAPHTLALAAPGEPLPPDAISRMDRGTVAVMRGGRNATAERPGVLHRSPALSGSGTVRLFLAIDDAGGAVDLDGVTAP